MKKTLLKIAPFYCPMGVKQNMSIGTVLKTTVNYSKYKDNFLIISPYPAEGAYDNDPQHIYVKPSKEKLNKPLITDSNRLTYVKQQDYYEGVVKLVNKIQPCLVEVEADLVLASIITRKCKAPVVTIAHFNINLYRSWYKRYITQPHKWFYATRLFYTCTRYLQHIIFVGQGLQKSFFKSFPRSKAKTEVIGNSYAYITDTNPPYKNKINQIVFIGRATRDKGYREYLLGVLPILKNYPKWTAVAVLSIETPFTQKRYNKFLENHPEIAEATKTGHLKILINYPNSKVVELLKQSKIMVAPTHKTWVEGCPMVCLEAHIAKCALVVSKNPGFIELCKEDAYYLPKVNPQNITEALEYFLSNPERIKELAYKGYHQVFKNYSAESILAKYDKIRESYLKKN